MHLTVAEKIRIQEVHVKNKIVRERFKFESLSLCAAMHISKVRFAKVPRQNAEHDFPAKNEIKAVISELWIAYGR